MSVAVASPHQTRSGIPGWVLALLIVSLAANFLVIGFVSTAVWRFHRQGPPPSVWVPPNLLGYVSTLPGERYKEMRELSAQERRDIRPARRELRAARNEVNAAIVAVPFDRQRFDAAQARLVAAENGARIAMQALYTQIATHLTDQERLNYAKWRERRRLPANSFLDEPERPSPAN